MQLAYSYIVFYNDTHEYNPAFKDGTYMKKLMGLMLCAVLLVVLAQGALARS